MLFNIKVFLLRCYMTIFKGVTAILPFKWPELHEGAGAAANMCRAIAADGHENILIVTDEMINKLGLLKSMQEAFDEAGVKWVVYDGVKPDPTVEQIEGGVTLLKEHNCDGILAVGGGSSIDAAKVIAARATNDKPIKKMTGLFRVWRRPLPLFAVPTTAGTGSEVTIAAVVSDTEAQRKLPMMDLKLMPLRAALDASLMTGLPAPITAATGMDALTHAVEAYVSRNAMDKTDEKAVEATQLIMQHLPTAYENGGNLEARQAMARASTLAGIAFTQAGVGYVHAIAHNFGALYHVPHGLANAIVLPHVLDYSKPNCAHRLADLARACDIGDKNASDAALADAFIARIREMAKNFGIPSHLDQLQKQDISRIADAALDEARFTYHVPRYMDKPTAETLIGQMLPQAA